MRTDCPFQATPGRARRCAAGPATDDRRFWDLAGGVACTEGMEARNQRPRGAAIRFARAKRSLIDTPLNRTRRRGDCSKHERLELTTKCWIDQIRGSIWRARDAKRIRAFRRDGG